jgi:DNA-binding NtrC family response regulator
MVKVLIVDDEKEFVGSLSRALGGGFEIEKAYSVEEAERIFEPFGFDVILLDIRLSEELQDKKGLDILRKIKVQNPDLPVLIMTAYGDIDTAVESLKLGAEDFIQKDRVKIDEYRLIINNLFKTGRLKRRVSTLESRLKSLDPWEIVGKDRKVSEARRLIKLVAEDGKASVLIKGETGTGKELVARAIHREGVRKDGPYVVVALASLNKETISSDLFGHEKGAYTGAISKRIGFIEEANCGVIFLDEIGELDPEIQIKLLRVIETGEVTRLGSNKRIRVDVQWVLATHRNLEELIEKGRFREDLYYRLKVFEINIPPLRERRGDIPLLIQHFLQLFREQDRTEVEMVSEEAIRALIEYDWPGNVRELRQVIEYSLLRAKLSKTSVVEVEHFPPEIRGEKVFAKEEIELPADMKKKLAELELHYIKEALRKTGKKTEAWSLLGYSNRFALRRRVLGIFSKYPELKGTFSSLYESFFKI